MGRSCAERIPERLTDASRQRRGEQTRRQNGRFVKGPIPILWITTAAKLPGKALHVGIALWFKCGLTGRGDDIAVTDSLVRDIMPMDRKTRYRALEALEDAGLIAVTRRRGIAPRVTILVDGASGGGGNMNRQATA